MASHCRAQTLRGYLLGFLRLMTALFEMWRITGSKNSGEKLRSSHTLPRAQTPA